MANWKKVVVSGSAPELANLQVDGLTADQVVIGGGSAGNLSTTAINGTGNIVATTAASGLEHSGSFSGSFEGSFSGDGTNLTGVTAEWDGTMFVGNVSGLASAQITGSGAAPSLILSGSTGNDLEVSNDAEIKGNTRLSGSLFIENRAAEQMLYAGANGLITGSDQLLYVQDSNKKGLYFQSGSNLDSGDPSGNSLIHGVQTIKMNQAGGGGIITATGNGAVGSTGNAGIQFGGGMADGNLNSISLFAGTGGTTFSANNDGTLTLKTAGSTRLTIGDTNSTFSNNLLVQGNTTLGNAQTDKTEVTGSFNLSGSFDIDVTGNNNGYDFTIDGVSDPALTFQTKKGFGAPKISLLRNAGFPNAKSIEIGNGGDDGEIKLYKENESQADVILRSNIVSVFGRNLVVGTRDTSTAFLGGKTGIAVSGSSKIKGDLDITGSLDVLGNIKASTGITSSNLTNDNLLVAGTNGEIESSGITFNGSALDLGSSNITTTGNGTFGGDVTISGDLAVAGTASFTHASNLDVADKYILLNSGSTGTSDSGGIVIQGPGQDIGDLFGYRSGSAKSNTQQRWGIASGFDAKTSADFTPSAFMSAVVVGTGNDPAVAGANYAQAGNMYIDTDAGYDGIWIYS